MIYYRSKPSENDLKKNNRRYRNFMRVAGFSAVILVVAAILAIQELFFGGL